MNKRQGYFHSFNRSFVPDACLTVATVYPQIYCRYCLPQEVKELLKKVVQIVNMNRTYSSFYGGGSMWTDQSPSL